ncbi:hypothetical protein NP493_1371g00028 [Ridgeia piscesae]|uniref:TIR domain-containing protein n=1 Tax=Ridgeia piscesae TaxID=27915 RepID=A0AAD9K7C0_RIDPI|nr:hypothetical protein NP493_1371g00028 [Ridgeia piscesae]
MFGSSPEQLSLDSSASLDDSAGGHVIGVSDDGDAGDDVTSQLLSAYLSKHRTPAMAPKLDDQNMYHVFFVYHHNDRDWVMGVQERLQSPAFHFRCCSQEYGVDACSVRSSLVRDETRYAMQRASKTAILLSRDFVSDAWCDAYEAPLLTEDDLATMAGDLLLILLQDCRVPPSLIDLPCVDPRDEDWWTKLLGHLCETGTILISWLWVGITSPSFCGNDHGC